MTSAVRQINDVFFRCASLQVAILIGKADDRIRVSDINPLGIWPGRVERNTVGATQAGGKNLRLLRLTVGGNSAKDLNFSAVTFCDEIISVRRSGNQAWIIKVGRIL